MIPALGASPPATPTEGASPAHPLGTDRLGRDTLSRLISGAPGMIDPTVVIRKINRIAPDLTELVALARKGLDGYLASRIDEVLAERPPRPRGPAGSAPDAARPRRVRPCGGPPRGR